MRTCTIARLTVETPQMSFIRRDSVANWLDDHAYELLTIGSEYTDGVFRARIMNPFSASKSWATLKLGAPGALSQQTRRRIAKWMQGRAKHLRNPNAVFDRRWFTQEFSL